MYLFSFHQDLCEQACIFYFTFKTYNHLCNTNSRYNIMHYLMSLRHKHIVKRLGWPQAQIEKKRISSEHQAVVRVATRTDGGFSTWPSTCLFQLAKLMLR